MLARILHTSWLLVGLAIPQTAVAASPTVVPDAYATTEDVGLAVAAPGLLDNDYDTDGDSFAVAGVVPPSHGMVSLVGSDGGFTYQPDPGFVGTDIFAYQVFDSGFVFSDWISVSIEVLPDPNRAPDALPEAYAVLEGDTLVVVNPGVLVNDTDPDGDPLTFASYMPPANGQLTLLSPNGAFAYAPNPGFSGTDSFDYACRDDSNEPSASVTVTIEVVPAATTTPVGAPDVYTVVEDGQLVVASPAMLENDLEPNALPLSVQSVSTPPNGTLTSIVTGGAFTYEPDPGFTGTDTFGYSATNGSVSYGPIDVTIEVRPDPNRRPGIISDSYGTPVDTTLVVPAPGPLVNDYDLDGDGLTLSSISTPSNGSITSVLVDGSFTYEPDPGFAGVDSFNYNIMAGGQFAPQSESVWIFVPEPGLALGLVVGSAVLMGMRRLR